MNRLFSINKKAIMILESKGSLVFCYSIISPISHSILVMRVRHPESNTVYVTVESNKLLMCYFC